MRRAAAFFVLFALSAVLAAAELRIADATAGDVPVRQFALLQALSDPDTSVSYNKVSAKEALETLAAGKAEIVVIDVPDIPKEFKGGRKVYAVRALVFYVNAVNTLESAKSSQLQDIFRSAESPRWQDYSFLSGEINRYGVKSGRPGMAYMMEFLPPDTQVAEKVRRYSSTAEVVVMVAADAVGLGFGVFMPTAPVQVRMLAVDGVAPTLKSVAETTYPLAMKRAVLTVAEPSEATRRFLEKMDGADFRDLVAEAGMLSVEK